MGAAAKVEQLSINGARSVASVTLGDGGINIGSEGQKQTLSLLFPGSLRNLGMSYSHADGGLSITWEDRSNGKAKSVFVPEHHIRQMEFKE